MLLTGFQRLPETLNPLTGNALSRKRLYGTSEHGSTCQDMSFPRRWVPSKHGHECEWQDLFSRWVVRKQVRIVLLIQGCFPGLVSCGADRAVLWSLDSCWHGSSSAALLSERFEEFIPGWISSGRGLLDRSGWLYFLYRCRAGWLQEARPERKKYWLNGNQMSLQDKHKPDKCWVGLWHKRTESTGLGSAALSSASITLHWHKPEFKVVHTLYHYNVWALAFICNKIRLVNRFKQ